MLKERPRVSVSTDLAGAFGSPLHVLQAYADSARALAEIDQPLRTEVLAFRHNFAYFIDMLARMGVHPNGIHGSSGPSVPQHDWIEKLKSPVFVRLFIPTKELLQSVHVPADGYLLLHETELNTSGAKETILANPPKSLLVLENVVYPGSLSRTLDKVQELQDHDLNVGIMIDLLHLAKEMGIVEQDMDKFYFEPVWRGVLMMLDKALSRVKVAGLHIPIGPNGDSLPLNAMEPGQWRMLAGIIAQYQEKIRFITLENQQKGAQLYLSKSAIPELNKRNGKIVSGLIETGVLR